MASYETYQQDLITIGVDIYNVEFEALGGEVVFPDSEELPSAKGILIQDEKDLDKLKLPDPSSDGRMPLFINAASRVQEEIGNEVNVSCAVVGPFTLSAILCGFEEFIFHLISNQNFAMKVMDFASKVSVSYAGAFAEKGLGVAINESWISPPLLSPDLYRKFVYPKEKEMIDQLKKMGVSNIALISGGNTTQIAESMIKTGSSLLIADPETDQKFYKELCAENNRILRANMSSGLIESGTEQEIRQEIERLIKLRGDYSKFVFGCGVVSYSTSVECMLKLKKYFKEIEKQDL